MKRLNVLVPDEAHVAIKTSATLRGVTITRYVLEAIATRMVKEQHEYEQENK